MAAEGYSFDTPGIEIRTQRQRQLTDLLREHQLLRRVPVHGLVFDVLTGRLHEVA